MESLGERIFLYLVFFPLGKEKNECVRKELIVMCDEMLFMEKNVCKQNNIEGNCV
jgi:hypothetical protein